ncbi:hypothetical protein [Shinella zoogloeoides]|uniref:hypothetical protein n=1 Tax=Shinella zoogloeoides TaxID=352475 RepID=UPI00299DEEB6|nr:hypothetical protein [Shinella zoogloeoides]
MKPTIQWSFDAALPAIALVIFSLLLFAMALNLQPTHAWLCGSYEDGTSCVRGLISEFQTLLTGLAAVAAATLTVRAMIKTELENAKRHRQILGATLRGEARQVDRLWARRLPPLRHASQVFRDVLEGLPSKVGPAGEKALMVHSLSSAAITAALKIKGEFHTVEWREAEHLFDGQLAAAVDFTTTSLAELLRHLNDIDAETGSMGRKIATFTERLQIAGSGELMDIIEASSAKLAVEKQVERIDVGIVALREKLPEVLEILQDVLEGLGRLKERYSEVDI